MFALAVLLARLLITGSGEWRLLIAGIGCVLIFMILRDIDGALSLSWLRMLSLLPEGTGSLSPDASTEYEDDHFTSFEIFGPHTGMSGVNPRGSWVDSMNPADPMSVMYQIDDDHHPLHGHLGIHYDD